MLMLLLVEPGCNSRMLGALLAMGSSALSFQHPSGAPASNARMLPMACCIAFT